MTESSRETREKFQVLHEFAKAARENLDDNIFSGTETETTVKRNRMAVETWALPGVSPTWKGSC